jgi:hypothetical protein
VDADRAFGAWQKASLGFTDNNGNGTWSATGTSTAVGLDKIDKNDYAGAKGVQAGGSSYALSSFSVYGVRPRNVALLPCIKY